MGIENRFLSGLDPQDLEVLTPSLRAVELTTDEVLTLPEASVANLYFPSGALLSENRTFEPFRSPGARLMGRDHAVGLLAVLTDEPALSRVVTRVAGMAWQMGAADFRGFAESRPSLMRSSLLAVRLDMQSLYQQGAIDGFLTVEERVAHWVLSACRLTGKTSVVVTQGQLADMLGVQRTTVTAAALALKDRGMLTYSRGRIAVFDMHGLEGIARRQSPLPSTRQSPLANDPKDYMIGAGV